MDQFTDFLAVSAGAVVGAGVRWLVLSHLKAIKPWSTFIVNMVGTLIIGVMYGVSSRLNSKITLFIGTGLCGSLTTFSSFCYDAFALIQSEDYLQTFLYLFFSVLAGMLIVTFGVFVGSSALANYPTLDAK